MTSLLERVHAALATVNDPEIRRPITEMGMVRSVTAADDGDVVVGVDLTVAGCPLKATITQEVTAAVAAVADVSSVRVELGVMSDEQRRALREQLRGNKPEPVNPFAQPGSPTKVYAIASGKGGVGKSTVTANLAVTLAQRGLSVGVIDADIYGFSIARMLGATTLPIKVDDMLIPPLAHEVKVISMGMFVPQGQPILWRGPKLHRAIEQFLTDVYWGDLDVLLLDLPPGTGDVALPVSQLLPTSQIVVVTTPQAAAAEVAERAGAIARQTGQGVAGVIENMSWLQQADGSRLAVFGEGGGERVTESLSLALTAQVALLGQVPLDMTVREGGDDGTPAALTHPDSPGAAALRAIAALLAA